MFAGKMKIIWIPQTIACLLLFLALNPDNPYEYYILLRFVCCAVFVYLTIQAITQQKEGLAWILGITAAMYNPFFRIHLIRDIWSFINLVTIGIAITSIFVLKKPVQEKER